MLIYLKCDRRSANHTAMYIFLDGFGNDAETNTPIFLLSYTKILKIVQTLVIQN